jgi:hypothetical protein
VRAAEDSLTPNVSPEPEIESRKHKDDADVCDQPLPELVPEEQDVYAHNNGYQSEHVERDGGLSSHGVIVGVGVFPDVGRAVSAGWKGAPIRQFPNALGAL